MTQSSTDPQPPPPTRWRAILSLVVMLIISIALLQIDFSALGSYGYLGVFGLSLLGNATVILPAPAFITAIAAGRTLNPWLVGLWSGLGAGIGETTGYLAGRAGSSIVSKSIQEHRIANHVRRYGSFAVFFFAAIPNPLMDVAGLAAGMLQMPFWKFIIACSAGKIIRFTLLALIAAYW